ncbi:hypothetical protein D2E25_1594 [Bifidobacterium goeldii]|uniref:SpaA-like prealbumin fold domain-containing protein n=1 Tax=Bifidobacterium goeldii TaxID=2306975 RepID=A0A430FHB6_9BIFI|nr:SpaA isopeptide-forming pilin-related protein [Bifidobacterium goeldii]RSX52181.1 hypothetical protein D2E25_1594 [Bifidobacterium goeldii]
MRVRGAKSTTRTVVQTFASLLIALAVLITGCYAGGSIALAAGATSTVTSVNAQWNRCSDYCTIDADTGRITFTPKRGISTLSATAQFDLTSSGQSSSSGGETISAKSLEWRIPAHLFIGRDGKPTGTTQIPVPEAPSYNVDTSLQYTYDEDTDEYVITNATDIPAANTFSVQITYNARARDVPDKDTKSDKPYAGSVIGSITSSATIKGSDEIKTTPPLTEVTDTGIVISDISKEYVGSATDDSLIPEEWRDSVYFDGLCYVLWKVTVSADGAQQGKVTIADEITDQLGGEVIGMLDASKNPVGVAWSEEFWGKEPYTIDIDDSSPQVRYILTYYYYDSLAGSSYTFENKVTGSLTGNDDGVTTEKSTTADQTVKNESFSYDKDQYSLDKYCQGESGLDTVCDANGGLTRLENDLDATSAMFVNHYAAKTYGLTTQKGSDNANSSGAVNSSRQEDYGQKYVRHEFIDDSFALGEETPGQMEQGGTRPDAENDPSIPVQGYAKLQPDDFYIKSFTIMHSCSAQGNSSCDVANTEFGKSSRGWTVYDWKINDSGSWGLVPRDPSVDAQSPATSDKLQIYGLVATYNSVTGQYNTAWQPMLGSTYANGGLDELASAAKDYTIDATQRWDGGRIVGIKAVYQSASAAAVELNIGVTIVLNPTDHVKTLLKQLNDTKTEVTDQLRTDYVTLTDFNTMIIRTQSQIEKGTKAVAGFDSRSDLQDSSCITDVGTYQGWHGYFNVLPFSNDEQYYEYPSGSRQAHTPPWSNSTTTAPLCHATAKQKLTPVSLTPVRKKKLTATFYDKVNNRVKLTYKAQMGESGDFSSDLVKKGTVKPQQSGMFYDLLPQGVVPDINSVKVLGADDRAEMIVTSVQTYANYKNSGRTLLVVKAKAPENYTNTLSESISTMTLAFDSYISYEDAVDLGYNTGAKKLHNVVAYQTGNEEISSGDDNDNLHNLGPDVLDNESWNDSEKTTMAGLDSSRTGDLYLYADALNNIVFGTISASGLTKHVRGGNQPDWVNGQNTVTVRAGGEYTYRLRYTPDNSTSASGVVLYDSLENYLSSDTSTSNQAVTTSTPRWQGTLSSVDVQEPMLLGIEPKVYCSTISGLTLFGKTGSANESNRDLTNTAIWENCTPSAQGNYDYSKVKAVAIDLSKAADGSDAKLGGGSSVQVTLVMNAPTDPFAVVDYMRADAHAYNGVHLKTTTIGSGNGATVESTNDIDFGYTRVGLIADTTTFTFTKVDGSTVDSGDGSTVKPLAGATFAIYRWVGSSDAPTSGLIDTSALGPDWEQVGTEQTSGEDGKVSLGGLMVGTYRLVETKTPNGFNKLNCQWAIKATQEYDGGMLQPIVIHTPTVVTASSGVSSPSDAPGFTKGSDGGFQLANYPGARLPDTGSIGSTALMIAGGITAFVGGGCLAIEHAKIRRRARHRSGTSAVPSGR